MTQTTSPKKKVLTAAAALSFCISSLIFANTAHAEELTDCSPREINASSLPEVSHCDMEGWTVVFDSGAKLVTPEAGMVVAYHETTTGRKPAEVALFNTGTQGVAVVSDNSLIASSTQRSEEIAKRDLQQLQTQRSPASAAALSKCTAAQEYKLDPGKGWWNKQYNYWINTRWAMSFAKMEIIKLAARNVANGTSPECGNKQNGLTENFEGTTAKVPAVGDVFCGERDHHSVVANFDFTGDTLGAACVWSFPPIGIVEADIGMDSSSVHWDISPNVGDPCGGGYDYLSVVTHEIGHAVGLDHVNNYKQTMYPYSAACDRSPRSLGLGDQNGLRAMYGN